MLKKQSEATGQSATVQSKKTVKGRVTDSSGNPLPGVSVVIQDTQKGIATDANGNFAIALADNEKNALVFSFIGMKTQVVKITNFDKEIKVVLREDAAVLGEVVATGMQVIKKNQMTGSASVITSKDIKDQGITSIDRILGGMVPGLNSTILSGAPGARAQITIRGENSLSGNTEPLWILDGLPILQGVPKNNSGNYAATIMQDGIANVMPEDIESITILKDASAAAIYGARAANGVIVITTKKGFRSKTQVSYTGNFEIGLAPKVNLDMMNSEEKLKYEKSIIDHFGLSYAYSVGRGSLFRKKLEGYTTPQEYDAEMQRLKSINTNWFDEIFRVSKSHSHNINLRGGTEELNYYTSINYTNKSGILTSNRFQNVGAFMTIDYRPSDKLILSLKISGNSRKNEEHASAIDPFNYAVFANPYERPYDENGNYAYDLSYLNNNYTNKTSSGYLYDRLNIMKELKENKLTQTGLDASFTFDAKYEPKPGLVFSLSARKTEGYKYDSREVNAGTYTSWVDEKLVRAAYPKMIVLPKEYDNGELGEASGRASSWTVRPQIDYSFTINKAHLFSLLGAFEATSRKFNNYGYTSPIYFSDYRITGLPLFADTKLEYDKLYKELKKLYTTSDGQDRSLSYIGTMRYSYNDRYVLNLNFRADGADVIGNKNQFTPLWSVGGRYNIHKEPFFKRGLITELSLRASYGFTGQIDRRAYPFSIMELGDMMYMGNRFVKEYGYPNPTVRWARKKDINLGLDFALLNNRIYLTTDIYSNRTDDVLSELNIPISTGRNQVYANGGTVQNRGAEFSLNVRWIENQDWIFSTRFNVSTNSNKILRSFYNFKSYEEMLSRGSVLMGGVYDIEGKEVRGVYGWKTAGVNPKTGNPMYYLSEKAKVPYAEFLKHFDELSDKEKAYYKKILPSVTEVPDAVDYDVEKQLREVWQIPSIQYLGQLNPKFIGGFNTYVRYKGFDFATDWVFKTGHIVPTFNDYQNAPRNLNRPDPSFMEAGYSSDLAVSSTNRQRKYLNYWQIPGDETNVRRFYADNNDLWSSMYTDEKYEKGDYLRLMNVSMSYRFNPKWIQKYHLTNLQIGINMRNLLTFTAYRGIDVATGKAFNYPVAKEFNVKVSLGF